MRYACTNPKRSRSLSKPPLLLPLLLLASILVLVFVGLIIINRNDIPTTTLEPAEPLVIQRAEKSYGDVVCVVGSVYDGDTFDATITDWPPIIGEHISIRINGIDTPEKYSKDDSVRRLANRARIFTIHQVRSAAKVELRNLRRDKYFRIDADVYVDGVLLSQLLVDNYLAKPYDGGTKPVWTAADYQKYVANKK